MRKLLLGSIIAALIVTGPAAFAAASNDNRANALEISAIPFLDSTSNVDATIEEGEPQPTCAPAGATLWYAMTAPSDASLVLSTEGSSFDTTLAVYADDLTEIRCNDDTDGLQSIVGLNAVEGARYYIQVGGYDTDTGDLSFSVNEGPSPTGPANDDFANATSIEGLPVSVDFYTTEATREDDEPSSCGFGPSLWYRYAPASSHTLRISTELYTPTPVVMTLYRGTDRTDLELITCTSTYGYAEPVKQADFHVSPLDVGVEAGATYYLQLVADYESAEGNLTFSELPTVDLALTGMRIRRERVRTEAGSAPVSVKQHVSVDVANLTPSAAPTPMELIITVCGETIFGGCDTIDYVNLFLAGEEEKTVTRTWNATGSAGDVRFYANLYVYDIDDPNYENNDRSAAGYVIVGGTGQGVIPPARCAVLVCV